MKEICIVLEKKLNLKYDKLIVKLKNFKSFDEIEFNFKIK